MYDCYGNIQKYLVEPVKVDYELSYSYSPIKTIMEGTFKTYFTVSEKGYRSGLTIQLNKQMAERFAAYNGLILIDEYQLDEILKGN